MRIDAGGARILVALTVRGEISYVTQNTERKHRTGHLEMNGSLRRRFVAVDNKLESIRGQLETSDVDH